MDDKRSTVQVVATFFVVKKLAPHLEAEIRALNSSIFRLEGIAVHAEVPVIAEIPQPAIPIPVVPAVKVFGKSAKVKK